MTAPIPAPTPTARRVCPGRLAGEIILVTGSTSGIGRTMAEIFAAEGASVVVTGRTREAGKSVEAGIRSSGGDAVFVPLDITDEEQVRAAFDAAVARYGKLTGLVNNAAWVQGRHDFDGPITEITLEDWELILKVNLTGTFLSLKYGLRALARSGGGSVVNISSAAGIVGVPGIDAYTASKGAIVSLTRSIAKYYARYNIRCNCLVVGFVASGGPSIVALEADPGYASQLRHQHLGRVGRPEDVAYLAAQLLSPQSEWITATVIAVDGGRTNTTHLDGAVRDMEGLPPTRVF